MIAAAGGGARASIDRVADLRARMYTQRDAATACVRLLNASAAIGCAADRARGPLLRLADPLADDVPADSAGAAARRRCASRRVTSVHERGLTRAARAGPRVLLVDEVQLGPLLARLRGDAALAGRVAGVLAAPGPAPPARASLAAAFPLAELAPYAPRAWAWNPGGAGLLREALPAPVLLLDSAAAADAARRAAANARQARPPAPPVRCAAGGGVRRTARLRLLR